MYDLDLLKGLAKRDDDGCGSSSPSCARPCGTQPGCPTASAMNPTARCKSVQYENGSDEAFLVWLWHELYGDEPFEASVLTRLKALPEPFAERLDGAVGYSIHKAARRRRMGQRPGDAARRTGREQRTWSAQPSTTSSPPCCRRPVSQA